MYYTYVMHVLYMYYACIITGDYREDWKYHSPIYPWLFDVFLDNLLYWEEPLPEWKARLQLNFMKVGTSNNIITVICLCAVPYVTEILL